MNADPLQDMTAKIVSVDVGCASQALDAYEVNTEDGPVVRNPPPGPCIIAMEKDGTRWVHTRKFGDSDSDWAAARRLVDKIRAAGVINLAHWGSYYPLYGSGAYNHEVELAQSYAKAHGPESLAGHYLAPLV